MRFDLTGFVSAFSSRFTGYTGIAAAVCVLALGLASCRQEEQNRPLSYTPGVYKGVKDTPLSDDARLELRQRGRHQNF